MKPNKRQKICHHCEGEVDLDVIVCPFCAADLREEKAQPHRPAYNPYSTAKNAGAEQSLYPSSYTPKAAEQETVLNESLSEAAATEEKTKNIFGPTLLFTLGVQLFLLGLLMVLFSHKGVIILKWDARHWFLYIFASIPLLIFGYRTLSKIG